MMFNFLNVFQERRIRIDYKVARFNNIYYKVVIHVRYLGIKICRMVITKKYILFVFKL